MDTTDASSLPGENSPTESAGGTNSPTGKAGIACQVAGILVPASVFLVVVLATLYAGPFLLAHWRNADAQAEADGQ